MRPASIAIPLLPALTVTLSACTATLAPPPPEVQTVVQTVYPDMPDIDLPDPPPLRAVHVVPLTDKTAVVGLSKEELAAQAFDLEQLKAYVGRLVARLNQVNVERQQWRSQQQQQQQQQSQPQSTLSPVVAPATAPDLATKPGS